LLAVTPVTSGITWATLDSNPASAVDVAGTLFFAALTPDGAGLYKTDGTAVGTSLVRSFGTTPNQLPQNLTAVGNTLYFSGFDPASGIELWRSDGTAPGTTLVRDLAPSTRNSNPGNLTNVNGTLFFSANDGATGSELWKSDGTAAGTVRLSDISPATGSAFSAGNADLFTPVGGLLFFRASVGLNGIAVYKSDGTPAGTVRVSNLISDGTRPTELTAVGNALFYNVSGELWKTDGTPAGTVRFSPGTRGSGLTERDGALVFGSSDAQHGTELWRTDGTLAGTALLKDINPGAATSSPNTFVHTDKLAFFLADDGLGMSLWRTDGTADGTFKLPATNVSKPTAAGARLYFTATDAATGSELWTSDGTPAGTVRVADVNAGPGGSAPIPLARAGGAFYFSADDGRKGRELYRTDGTADGTTLVKDLNTTPVPSGVANPVEFKGFVYFSAPGGLYKTDGTAAGTSRVTGLTPSHYAVMGDSLYFTTGDLSTTASLWKTDGTGAGTSLVTEFTLPQPYAGSVGRLAAFNNRLYFAAPRYTVAQGGTQELYTSDGTPAGTHLVQDPAAAPRAESPRAFTEVNGTLFFYAAASDHGFELWKTDGTSAGTTQVKEIFAGAPSSNSSDPDKPVMQNLNGLLIFGANADYNDRELWRSDGTDAGTYKVKDLNGDPRSGSGMIGDPLVVNGVGYFIGIDDATFLTSLYRTDGTAAGTAAVKRIDTGDVVSLGSAGGKVFIVTKSSATNPEYVLWASDGTPAGTTVLHRFRTTGPGQQPGVDRIVASDGLAYFAGGDAGDGSGIELWASDGTPQGTMPIADIRPGADSSLPQDLLDVNGTLYFTAVDSTGNRQLFRATRPTAPPAAPSGLTATASGPARVDLSWADNASDESGFVIERSLVSDFSEIDATFNARADATTFSDTLAEPDREYYYRVRAFNIAGPSDYASAFVATGLVDRPAYGTVAPGSEIYVPFDQNTEPLVPFHGQVFFNAYTYERGWKFSKSDGKSITTLDDQPVMAATPLGDSLYYVSEAALWKTNGTPGGGVKVHQFSPGMEPRSLTPFAGRLYFAAADGAHGRELWVSDGTDAGTVMFKDIAPPDTVTGGSSIPDGFTVAGDNLFFYAHDGEHGFELWKTDGTPGGTALVQDIQTGTAGSMGDSAGPFQGDMEAIGNTLYFRAYGPGSRPGVPVPALYKSDGTDAGTVVVAPLMPSNLTAVGNKLYFFGYPPDAGAVSLYVSDGTPAGTVPLKAIPPTRFYPHELTPLGGKVYFDDGVSLWASDGTSGGTRVLHSFGAFNDPTVEGLTAVAGKLYFRGGDKLWTSDGTVDGTVQVDDPEAPSLVPGAPRQFANSGDVLFFTAKVEGVVDRPERLWRLAPALAPSDLPAAPTNVSATAVSGVQIDLTWADASGNETGFRIERSSRPDFATIDKALTVPASTTSYSDHSGVVRGGTYYYRVRSYNRTGHSDYVAAAPVTAPLAPADPSGFAAAVLDAATVRLRWNDNSADETGFVLQRSRYADFHAVEATANLPADTSEYTDTGLSRLTSYYYRLYAVNAAGGSDRVFASASTPEALPATPTGVDAFPVSGSEITVRWTDAADNEIGYVVERAEADGPFQGLLTLPANSVEYTDPGRTSGAVYRYRVSAVNAAGAAATPATPPVTTLPPQLTNLVQEFPGLTPETMTRVGDTVFMGGNRLWKSDGTSAGTVALTDNVSASRLVAADGLLYFVGGDAATGGEVWVSDGTLAGTHVVKDIVPGNESGETLPLSAIGRTLFFGQRVDSGDFDLWKTDGTEAGTVRVGTQQFTALRITSYPHTYGVSNGVFYYPVRSPDGGGSILWRTDGTDAGTRKVAGISNNQQGGDVAYGLTDVNGTLFFGAFDTTRGLGLWKIDNATGRAALVKDLYDGDFPALYNLAAAGGKLYFSDFTLAQGSELWVSDGTSAGTKLVKDVLPGTAGSTPRWITGVGDDVYFLASDNGRAFDLEDAALWKTDGTAAGTVRIRDFSDPRSGGNSGTYLVAAGDTLFYSDTTYVWRSDGTSRGTVKVTRAEGLSTFVADTAVAIGDTLFFTAPRADGNGRDLYTASATPPAAPGDLTISGGQALQAPAAAVAAAADGVTLRWTDRSSNESGFAVERSRRADFATMDHVFYTAPDATTFTDVTGEPGATYFYRVRAVNAGGDSAYSNRAGNGGGVVARNIFYNGSAYDGNNVAADAADDGAIAPDKQALLPGQGAGTIANVTSYARGINGIMVDLLGIRADVTADDFDFRVGPGDGTWSAAPVPSSIVRRVGAGVGGSDRVTFIWAEGRIRNAWLQVTVKATARTGLATPDVFYFGNAAGEAGDSNSIARPNALDLAAVRRALNSTSDLTGRLDFNRDGRVNALDLAVVRRNLNQGLLLQFVPPARGAQAESLTPAGVEPRTDRVADDVLV
jgi:ELWxxDGT repeat protein